MSAPQGPSGKLPGKTLYSGRRRTATRRAGYESHPDATGGDYRVAVAEGVRLPAGTSVSIQFSHDTPPPDTWVGFGGWVCAPDSVSWAFEGVGVPTRITSSENASPNWSKFGSMWLSDGEGFVASLTLSASEDAVVFFWDLDCGAIEHTHLDNARPALLTNMHDFSPEAHFYSDEGETIVEFEGYVPDESLHQELHLKQCNRCARFLPINVFDERRHLSYSNHCVAEHRRPCSHTGFGLLTNVETGEKLDLEYGYQLECRFCKKFEVNAAHNPQRTAAQMKEDGARRRAFELLLAELYEASPQLRYRHETGRELTDDVHERFEGKCFNCGADLGSPNDMHLDHTRPLALLWPLDGSATALCGSCNSEKRDRPPVAFYAPEQLLHLASLTRLEISELLDPAPNLAAVELIRDRLDWFFDEFLTKEELTRERDGKTAAELVVKALQKVINFAPPEARFSLKKEFDRRRA